MTEKFLFGTTSDNHEIYGFKISNKNGFEATFIEYGAIIQSIVVKDKNNKPLDVVLGYDDISGYETDPYHFGAIIGRNANRIENACFKIGGNTYQLAKNSLDRNSLHSGPSFYGKRIWASEYTDDSVSFILNSMDGDQGFPGNMHIIVKYAVTDENSVKMSILGTTDADTVFNMTNHVYFNLNGEGNGIITDHFAQIPSVNILKSDKYLVPTGEIINIKGSEFDFTDKKSINPGVNSENDLIQAAGGYDHNYCIDGSGKRKMAKIFGDKSGICLTMYSSLPGMQFYTGNFVGNRESAPGKSGHVYPKRSGFALEPQFYPNAINIPEFESPILKAGECFQSETEYIFTVE